jgi:hypothetical protein
MAKRMGLEIMSSGLYFTVSYHDRRLAHVDP